MSTKNYARFWAIFNKMPSSDKNELRRSLIRQFTDGRTDSLRDMSDREYNALCDNLQEMYGDKERRAKAYEMLKKKRSAVLLQMQIMGINTADWNAVDDYCLDKRKAGKVFRELTAGELDTLLVKLHIIERQKLENNILLN